MPKRHYTVKSFSGGMVTTQPGSDIRDDQYMFGYDIDPSYPGGLRGRKVDLDIKTSGISGTPLKAIRAELDAIYQVLQTTTGLYALTDTIGAAPSPAALASTAGAMEANNKAVHIGTGPSTPAKWFGPVAHQQFGVAPVATPAIYDSALAPPSFTAGNTFGTGDKGVRDGSSTGMVFIQSDGKSLVRFTTGSPYYDSQSDQIFQNATAICDDGVQSGYVLVYDSGTNTLYRINSSNWSVHSKMAISPNIADTTADRIVSDMETTSSHIYFVVSGTGGSVSGGNSDGNELWQEPKGWLYRMDKQLSAGGQVTDISPRFQQATTSLHAYHNTVGYIPLSSLQDFTISMQVSRRSLFRISSSQLGVYCRLELNGNYSYINVDEYAQTIVSGLYAFNGVASYISLNNTSIIRIDSGTSTNTVLGFQNTHGCSATFQQNLVWLSYESSSLHRGYYSETGQNFYDSGSATLTGTTQTLSIGGASSVSTSLLKSAAMVRISGTYWLLNGDPTMEFVGRFSDQTTARVASLGTISLSALDNGFSEGDNTTYYYKFSYLYDGFQESPLTGGEMSISPGPGKKIAIKVYIPTTPTPNRRISHINIYRAQSAGTAKSFFQLVETVSLAANITSATVTYGDTSISGRPFTYTDNYSLNQLGPTYESNAGLPETLTTSTVQYGLSAQIGGYHFVADCGHSVIPNAGQYIFRSVQGQFDNFNYLSNILRLPEKPIELAAFRSRLYAFTKNRIWRIEPNNFYIEDEMNGYGVVNKGAVVVTELGMFFAGPNGIYYTDGSTPQDISFPVNRNYSNETFGNLNTAYLDRMSNNVLLNYDPRNRLLLVHYRPAGSTNYRSLVYSVDQQRWDHWDGTAYGDACGAPCSLSSGIPTIVNGGKLVAVAGGTTDKTVTYYGPWLDMGEPGTEKWFYQVKLQVRDAAPSSILVEIDDEGAVSLTSAATLEEGTTMPASNKDAVYSYNIPQASGDYRKGKRIRLAFTATSPCKIDSYSIVYREKIFKGAK